MKIDENTSMVFETFKFCAICLVFFGHFFSDTIPLIYIPVTSALIVFSFSSGYFTNLKYNDTFNLKIFWKKKFQRLGIKLVVINCFLLFVFLLQNRPGIWTWQTIVNFFGLTGILNWLHIKNPSPYGRGMWFFTLLVIFYTVYPALRKIRSKHWHIFTMIVILIFYICSRVHNPGHALYLSAAGFIAGAYWIEGDNFRISPFLNICLCVLCLIGLLIFNLAFQFNELNFFFIFFFSVFFILALSKMQIKKSVFHYISIVSPCVFEIYLIHPYFSIRPTQNQGIDCAVSFIIILSLSIFLNRISRFAINRIQR